MRSLDEEIAAYLQEAAAAGELRQAPSYGKPMDENDGWDETQRGRTLSVTVIGPTVRQT
jgi:hypothetical protein